MVLSGWTPADPRAASAVPTNRFAPVVVGAVVLCGRGRMQARTRPQVPASHICWVPADAGVAQGPRDTKQVER